jgi:hypothetical protein
MTPEEWFAQISGQVETLVLAYAGMVATHPNPQAALALLDSMAKTTTTEADASPQQAAYLAGTKTAIAQLSAAVKLAQDIHSMNQAGAQH